MDLQEAVKDHVSSYTNKVIQNRVNTLINNKE